MVDRIIRTYGATALSGIAAAYRNGATDDEALRAGTGVPATQLYTDYFRSFGAAEPKPIPAASIGPSIVHTGVNAGSGGQSTTAPNGSPAEPGDARSNALTIGLVVGVVVVIGLVVLGAILVRGRRPRGLP